MRIGDLLIEKGLVSASDIAAARASTQVGRLCSVLITRGALEFDAAARALGEQHGVPAALQRHLEGRDLSLAAKLPRDFGRASCALPIGRTTGGAMIVAARDPDAALRTSLERLIGSVTVVITPATRLEQLIEAAYGEAPRDEFDIDLHSAVDLVPLEPPPPDVDMLDPDSVRMALSSLDDVRVVKDPNQSGLIQMATLSSSPNIKIQPTGRMLPRAAPKITATVEALERATSREAASDLAMSFIAGRWLAGAIVVVREGTAIGYRGHGITDLSELHLPLRLPSTVARAIQMQQVATTMPPSPAQDQLARVLHAQVIVAAPVVVDDAVIAVLTTGDSIHGPADTDAANELGQLAYALAEAWDRIRRR
ncbi:hypothetical protein BH11MYX1_BH11MYX1_26840 [soil metagenome]